MFYRPAIAVISGKQIVFCRLHRLLRLLQRIPGGEQSIFRNAALLILQLLGSIGGLFAGQGGLGCGENLPVILNLGIEHPEAQLIILN